MIRSGKLNPQNVVGESGLQVLQSIFTRPRQAHEFSSLNMVLSVNNGRQRVKAKQTSSRIRLNSSPLNSSSFSSWLNFKRRSLSVSFDRALGPGMMETWTESWAELRRSTI